MASRQFYMPQFFADAEKNKGATDLTRKFGKFRKFRNGDNSQFLAFVAQQLKDIKPAKAESPSHAADGTLAIALLGCYGMFGYGLRRSQEVIRLDRSPSYWSHALIFPDGFAEDKKAGRAMPAHGFLKRPCILPASSMTGCIGTVSHLGDFRIIRILSSHGRTRRARRILP
jgi:hypothetical protein